MGPGQGCALDGAWEAGTRAQTRGWAQAPCALPSHSPKASMHPRSSSSTVQPLSRSRVPAMAASAGWAGLRLRSGSLPPVSDRTPVPGEADRESAEARAGERPRGQKRGGAGTPPAGQGRSCPPRPLPGLNGLARDGATRQLGNGPADRLPAHPRSRGRAEGLHEDGEARIPGLAGAQPPQAPFSSRPLPRGTCSTPQLGSAPLPLPSLHSLPSPAGLFWEPGA